MSVMEMRAELHQLIDQIDDRLLKAVHSMVNVYQEEDEIIGYRIGTNEPVYKSKLGEELDAIVEEVENGDYITLEDLKAESETW